MCLKFLKHTFTHVSCVQGKERGDRVSAGKNIWRIGGEIERREREGWGAVLAMKGLLREREKMNKNMRVINTFFIEIIIGL